MGQVPKISKITPAIVSKLLGHSVLVLALATGCASSQVSKQKNSDSGADSTESGAPRVLPAAALSADNVFSRIAFGSCVEQMQPQPLWNQILEAKPELFLGLGDSVYVAKYPQETFSSAYERQLTQTTFTHFRSLVPMLSTWDDQDYGQNDGGEDNPRKVEAKEQFLKFHAVSREAIVAEHGGVLPPDGIYYSKILGPPGKRIQILFLDVRWYRSPWLRISETEKGYQPDPSPLKTILGETQWKWLEEKLKVKDVKLRVLVSGIQVLMNENTFEKWGNFPLEQKKLIDLLFQSQKLTQVPVVILSGDRHAGEISRLKRKNLELLDFTASSINRPTTREEENALRISFREKGPNFGVMSFNWKANTVDIELLDQNGKIIGGDSAKSLSARSSGRSAKVKSKGNEVRKLGALHAGGYRLRLAP